MGHVFGSGSKGGRAPRAGAAAPHVPGASRGFFRDWGTALGHVFGFGSKAWARACAPCARLRAPRAGAAAPHVPGASRGFFRDWGTALGHVFGSGASVGARPARDCARLVPGRAFAPRLAPRALGPSRGFFRDWGTAMGHVFGSAIKRGRAPRAAPRAGPRLVPGRASCRGPVVAFSGTGAPARATSSVRRGRAPEIVGAVRHTGVMARSTAMAGPHRPRRGTAVRAGAVPARAPTADRCAAARASALLVDTSSVRVGAKLAGAPC